MFRQNGSRSLTDTLAHFLATSSMSACFQPKDANRTDCSDMAVESSHYSKIKFPVCSPLSILSQLKQARKTVSSSRCVAMWQIQKTVSLYVSDRSSIHVTVVYVSDDLFGYYHNLTTNFLVRYLCCICVDLHRIYLITRVQADVVHEDVYRPLLEQTDRYSPA